MSKIIAIAGGSGGLGRAMVEAFKNSSYTPLVLARKADPTLEKDLGVSVLQANYSDVESLLQLLEIHKIDTVISTISNYDNSHSAELSLIEAAERSNVTRRYIPSVWSGFDYSAQHAEESTMAASRLAPLSALQKTSLEWTALYTGIFLDFYALTVRSHVPRTALGMDVDGNAAAIPGDGKYPIYFTHTSDIAKYTVALLGLERWETKYFLYADKKTWAEVVNVAEAAKGVKFDVAYDSVEKLKQGEMTELPGHKAVYEGFFGGPEGKAMFQKVMAGAAVYMAEGLMKYDGPFLQDIFPDIQPLTVEQALLGDKAA